MKTHNDFTPLKQELHKQLKRELHQHTHRLCWCSVLSICRNKQTILKDQIRILKESQPLTWHHPYTKEELESMGWIFANKEKILKYVESKTIEISNDCLKIISDDDSSGDTKIVVFTLPFQSSIKAAEILCGN